MRSTPKFSNGLMDQWLDGGTEDFLDREGGRTSWGDKGPIGGPPHPPPYSVTLLVDLCAVMFQIPSTNFGTSVGIAVGCC